MVTTKFLILCISLVSIQSVQSQMYSGAWMNNLFENINRMVKNVNENTNNLNQQIQENVNNQIRQAQQSGTTSGGGQQVITGFNGNSYYSSSMPGISKSIVSGYTADGQPYRREIEEKIIGNILHHTEIIYNPALQTMKEFHYTLDLSDPNATPIYNRLISKTRL